MTSLTTRICSKCGGSWGIKVSLNPGHIRGDKLRHNCTEEHLDYRCEGCGYEWEGDCLDAEGKE